MTFLKNISQDEFAPYFKMYMELSDKESELNQLLVSSLKNSINFIESIEKPLDYSYDSGKWSIGQVLQHNIDTERVFAYRALRFLRGDRTSLSGFDQDVFMDNLGDHAFAKAELIQSLNTTRLSTIELFKNAANSSLLFKGTASGQIMTARVIPFLIAGHSLHHENIIRERYLD